MSLNLVTVNISSLTIALLSLILLFIVCSIWWGVVSGKCDANVSDVLLAAQGGNVKGEIGSAPGVSARNY